MLIDGKDENDVFKKYNCDRPKIMEIYRDLLFARKIEKYYRNIEDDICCGDHDVCMSEEKVWMTNLD